MRLIDLLALSWGQVRRGGVRSLLCGCTVAVGVCAMAVIGAVGSVAQAEMHTAIHAIGLRGMTCYLEEAQGGEALTPAFAEAVCRICPEVTAAMPVKYQNGRYQNGFHQGNAMLFGVTAEMQEVLEIEVLNGRLFTAGEAAQPVRRAVISQSLAQTLFGRTEVAGRSFYLQVGGEEQLFEILGVIADQTALLSGIAGGVMPTIIYLPYAMLTDGAQTADQVLLACKGDAQALKQRLNTIVCGAMGMKSRIGVQNLTGYLEIVDDMAQKAVWVFLLVASVSMFTALGAVAGGMLSAAHEMREEIGIYRAIGSRQRDIFFLFVLQAAILCALGAGAGLLTAQGLCMVGSRLTGYPLVIPVRLIAGCALIAIGCGVLSGLAPALHAAHLDPVKAMKR